jgi:hypothetical protein
MSTIFNPTTGLEPVESASQLVKGDKVLVTYFKPNGELSSVASYDILGLGGEQYAYLFEDASHRQVHFLVKVDRPQLRLKPGTFGVGVTAGGRVVRGYVDYDGDLCAITESGESDVYLASEELTRFEEIKLELPVLAQAEPEPKLEGLVPGVDGLPAGVDHLVDKDGDRWYPDEEALRAAERRGDLRSFSFTRINSLGEVKRSWADPDYFMKQYAPFKAVLKGE